MNTGICAFICLFPHIVNSHSCLRICTYVNILETQAEISSVYPKLEVRAPGPRVDAGASNGNSQNGRDDLI